MYILVSSRNNYEMFENFFLKKNIFPNNKIINADAGSTYVNIEKGKKICNKYNIKFLQTKKTGLQSVVSETISFLKEKKINDTKWLLYIHTDAYLTEKSYLNINIITRDSYFDQFGLIGFNTIFWPHTKKITSIDLSNKFYFGLMGKSILSENNISVYGPHTIKNKKIQKLWNNLVAVEAVMDIGLLINVNLFKKHITPSEKFPFICSFDDIAMQFLKKNIYNITVPNIYCIHDPWVKKKFNLPVSSPKALSKKFLKNLYNDDLLYIDEWIRKWKFDRRYKNSLKKPIVNNNIIKKMYTFVSNLNRKSKVKLSSDTKKIYKDNLIGQFMHHSNLKPFKIFNKFKY